MIIGHLIEDIPIAYEETLNSEIDKLFKEDSSLRGVVICRDLVPIAYLSKTRFYQKIGSKYGYDLYFNRPCNLLGETEPLIVSFNKPILEVSKMAMERNREELYDEIIVTLHGNYVGVVDIRTLLLNLVESQVQIASYLNPLSKLPGNEIINEKLQEALLRPSISVLYFDLDNFKSYNDHYGFKQGDHLLLFLIDLLKKKISGEDFFLGHIGGDDFIAIISNETVDAICKDIITTFDQHIIQFYEQQDLTNPPCITGRNGEEIPLPICTLSIAVLQKKHENEISTVEELANLAAKVKKKCKDVGGSCYIVETHQLQLS